MAYRRSTRRRSYRRGSVSSRRETFQAKQWGRFGLTTANQQIAPLNLLEHYENLTTPTTAGGVDVNNCTILGVRGWITWAYGTDTITDAEALDTRIGFGIRTLSSSVATQLNELTERQAVGPYATGLSAWDNWIWRRSRPMYDDSPGDGTAPALLRDQERTAYIWQLGFKISTSNMRKLRRGESLYLLGGLNFDPGSAGDVECRYEINTALAKP